MATLDDRPEGSAKTQLETYGIVDVRHGWVEIDVDGAIVRFGDPAGDRILQAAPAGDGWVVDVDGHLAADGLDDQETALAVAGAYLRDHPTTCDSGETGCPGRFGLEHGVLPCLACWMDADREQLDEWRRAVGIHHGGSIDLTQEDDDAG